MKKHLGELVLAIVPLILGLLMALGLQILFKRLPVLVLRVDVGTALAILSGLATAGLVVRLLSHIEEERECQHILVQERRAQADSHRRFISRLDHEVKNPLTGMRAALANLAGTPPGEDQAAALHDLKHQTERLSRLVSDLRKLAELEQRPLECLPVPVGELLGEAVEAAESHPASHGRKINLVLSQVPWPLPPVTGDRDLLGLAFYNLLDNALKFTRPEDTVEVRAAEDGHWLTVEVADTGSGIAAEDLPRVFEELYRGANARGSEGSGLGLSLVRRVVERHGGDISVRSRQSDQKGTVFKVRLPLQ
jgi:two-component system OmpR family sensor kinase